MAAVGHIEMCPPLGAQKLGFWRLQNLRIFEAFASLRTMEDINFTPIYDLLITYVSSQHI